MHVVMKEIYTSKSIEVITRMIGGLVCNKETDDLFFFIHYNGWRAYNYKPYPEYKFKHLFAPSTEPIEVYSIIVLSESETIPDEQRKRIENQVKSLAELYEEI